MSDVSTCIRSIDHAPSFREYCEELHICGACGDDLFDCRCAADLDLEGEARAFAARRDDDAIDYAMSVHLEPAPEPVRASSWKRTADPQLSWRWVRSPGGLALEQRRGTTTSRRSSDAVNRAAWRGDRDATLLQRAVGGGR